MWSFVVEVLVLCGELEVEEKYVRDKKLMSCSTSDKMFDGSSRKPRLEQGLFSEWPGEYCTIVIFLLFVTV